MTTASQFPTILPADHPSEPARDHHGDPDAVPPVAGRARDRILGLSGVGFFALLLPVIAIPHASLDYDITKPPAGAVITAFYRQHYALEQWQALMHSLAGVVLVIFGAALAAQVRRHERAGQVASRLVAVGAAVAGAVMVLTMALVAGSIAMTGGVDGRTQGWLYQIGWTEHFKALYLLPLVMVPAGLVLGRSRALPRVLTWAGQLIAVVCVVAMIAGIDAGTAFLQYPAFFLVMIWTLATGVVALTRGVGDRA